MKCRQNWTEEQHWLNSPLWEEAGLLPLSFEKRQRWKGMVIHMAKKEKRNQGQDYVERNKTPEISFDLFSLVRYLWNYVLLSALGRLDHGIPEL